jgi:polyhydroxybutyrate depolymerase
MRLGMRRLLGALVVLCAACLAQAAPALPPKGTLATAQERALEHDGQSRSYLIATPPASDRGKRPLVVLLHGGTQTPQQAWTQTSLPTLGQREGFIVVAPQGLHRHWNDGRGSTLARDGPSTADDVGFLRAVIADVVRRDDADPSAVFMAGVSNGGFMTMRFACEAGDVLRAAASLIADLPRALAATCRPARPLPWLAINGTDDPIIPFAGQEDGVVKGGQRQPALMSADETWAFWADRAGCAPAVTVQHVGQAERRERAGCAGRTTSVQWVLHGAGHVPPGLDIKSWLVRGVVGAPNLDVDAGTLVWDHFRASLGGQ